MYEAPPLHAFTVTHTSLTAASVMFLTLDPSESAYRRFYSWYKLKSRQTGHRYREKHFLCGCEANERHPEIQPSWQSLLDGWQRFQVRMSSAGLISNQRTLKATLNAFKYSWLALELSYTLEHVPNHHRAVTHVNHNMIQCDNLTKMLAAMSDYKKKVSNIVHNHTDTHTHTAKKQKKHITLLLLILIYII